jgi:hypothetical protein
MAGSQTSAAHGRIKHSVRVLGKLYALLKGLMEDAVSRDASPTQQVRVHVRCDGGAAGAAHTFVRSLRVCTLVPQVPQVPQVLQRRLAGCIEEVAHLAKAQKEMGAYVESLRSLLAQIQGSAADASAHNDGGGSPGLENGDAGKHA